MKKCIAKKIMLLSTLFTSVVFMFMGCASTGGAENIENVKASIATALDADVTWAEDFKVKSYKNLYTEEYALYKSQNMTTHATLCGRVFTHPTKAIYIQDNLFGWIKDNNISKDIRELKKGDIFVLPVKDENYIFLITTHNKSGALRITSEGVSVQSGVIRHLDRYYGWGYKIGSSDFEEVYHYNGTVGKPVYLKNTTIYPWVNLEKGEVTYMILDIEKKSIEEFDLKFLGSYKK